MPVSTLVVQALVESIRVIKDDVAKLEVSTRRPEDAHKELEAQLVTVSRSIACLVKGCIVAIQKLQREQDVLKACLKEDTDDIRRNIEVRCGLGTLVVCHYERPIAPLLAHIVALVPSGGAPKCTFFWHEEEEEG